MATVTGVASMTCVRTVALVTRVRVVAVMATVGVTLVGWLVTVSAHVRATYP